MSNYVYARSKKDLNKRLAKGETIYVTEYHLGTREEFDIRQLEHGAVVRIFSTMVSGQPVAKSYGEWNAKKRRVQ